jgi:hypothetical protein
MQYKKLPDWVNNLKKNPRLSSTGFRIFDEEEFKAGKQKKSKASTFAYVGCSETLAQESMVRITVDPDRIGEARITLNEEELGIYFYCEPTIEALEKVHKMYVERGLKIPKDDKELSSVARLRANRPKTFASPDKKKVMHCIGVGDWDQMSEFENHMLYDRFVNEYVICLATGAGVDGNKTQYYTSFSASLCSLIRSKVYDEETLFCLSVEYKPVDPGFTRQFKTFYPDNALVQQMPEDIPLDAIGLLLRSGFNLSSMEEVFRRTQGGDYASLYVLASMIDWMPEEFEKYMLPLASHADQNIRDYIAQLASREKQQKVLEAAVKHGVSKNVLKQIKAKR